MVLESTIICVDNSEYMRNGDFVPTRLIAQREAVILIYRKILRSNPENNVGLLTLASRQVMMNLTRDVGNFLSKLEQIKLSGEVKLDIGLSVAHLALKHRPSKIHKQRLVVFIGSPLVMDTTSLFKLAKTFKKEKVNIDIINFGSEAEANTTILNQFINILNGKEGKSNHLLTLTLGENLSEIIAASPIVKNQYISEEGAFSNNSVLFGVADEVDDPDLLLALRMSLEEQRQHQQAERSRTAEDASVPAALQGLVEQFVKENTGVTEQGLDEMTEEQQLHLAIKMSLVDAPDSDPGQVSVQEKQKESEDIDDLTIFSDPDFIQNYLESLSGVPSDTDPMQETIDKLKRKKKDDKEKEK